MPNGPVNFNRYSNRRLYSGNAKKYVSLSEIEEMIAAGTDIEIVDIATVEDITRVVLIQMIVEQRPEKVALFPLSMLHSILRSNHVVIGFLRDYFRNSWAYLDYFRSHGASMSPREPMHWKIAAMAGWSEWPPANGANQPGAATPVDDQVDVVARIEELEQRLVELEQQRSPHA